jgi:DNA-binding MarR family transcriptional regulator
VDPVVVLDKAFELAAHVEELMRHALAERGLTAARAEALLTIHQHGRPLVQRELAQLLRCTPRHVTSLVDTLEQQGWVRRGPHPTDRRATLLSLTGTGQETATWMATNRERAAHALLGDVGPAALEGFVTVADLLIRQTSRTSGPPPEAST